MFILRYKSIPILLLLFFIFIPHSSNAQQFENARSYFSFIDSHNAKIVEQTWYYMESYTTSDDQFKIKGQRKRLENILKFSLRKINKAKAHDQKLQTAAIDYLEGNLIMIKNLLV
ncbi:MAG: hypothetical protein ABF274_09365 [Nonlabens sp.]|uniref:hypothetical protein n=1 Tax=Nonlabens sp. TaxID=1888209 RepID=UPI00321A2AD1